MSSRRYPLARWWLAAAAVTAAVSLAVASPASADTLTWSAAATPNPGATINDLYGVSCVSTTACTAVGFYVTGRGLYKTLIESWDGTRWSVVPSPSPGLFPQLYGVSCVSATACIAVGSTAAHRRSGDRTLIESWDGTSWSVVPSTGRGVPGFLISVSCVSVTACTAVGSAGEAGLIESWNGTEWSVVPSSDPGGPIYYYGVSCVSATACIATGSRFVAGAGYQTLVESWNGTSWSVVPSPSPGHPDQDALGSVSCLSATDCIAVGEYNGYGPQDPIKTLVESWDGTSWSVVPSPSHSASVSQLDSVSCVSATACTAAGYRENAKYHDRTVIETGTAGP